jgi:hypothetical protein
MEELMLMLPKTSNRVQEHTDPAVNAAIKERTERNIHVYSSAGSEAISHRLEELNREWDIERALETNAAGLSLLGLALGTFVNRKWYALPAVVTGFLLQHGLQGWCPPVSLFRRMGIRTAAEIEYERYMLKAKRGDFSSASGETSSGTTFEHPEYSQA